MINQISEENKDSSRTMKYFRLIPFVSRIRNNVNMSTIFSSEVAHLLKEGNTRNDLSHKDFFQVTTDRKATFFSTKNELENHIRKDYSLGYYVEIYKDICRFVRYDKDISEVESFRCEFSGRVSAISWIRKDMNVFSDMAKWCSKEKKLFNKDVYAVTFFFCSEGVPEDYFYTSMKVDKGDPPLSIRIYENIPESLLDSFAMSVCKNNLLALGKYVKVINNPESGADAIMVNIATGQEHRLQGEEIIKIRIFSFNSRLMPKEIIEEMETTPLIYEDDEEELDLLDE